MNSTTRVTATEFERLVEEFPYLPSDYFAHLREVGWGIQVNGRMLYSGPICPTEIYGDRVLGSSVLLLGDDMMGYCFGYDRNHQVYGEYSDAGEWEPWLANEGFNVFLL